MAELADFLLGLMICGLLLTGIGVAGIAIFSSWRKP